MRVALYARVSMDEKHKDHRYQEPENQLQPLRQWAQNAGWEVTKEYVDKASGADSGRPEFGALIRAARTHEFDCILVWKLDRFSREPMLNTLAYIQRLRGYKVGLKSLTESWLDTSAENPLTDVILAVMSWTAGEERRKISERTKAGIARRRALGNWNGGRPKGSKNKNGYKKRGVKEDLPLY